MIRFAVLLWTLRLSLSLSPRFPYLAAFVDPLLRKTTCPVAITPSLQYKEIQASCNGFFANLTTDCVDKGHELLAINKLSRFRGQVICDFVSDPEFPEQVKDEKLDVDQYLETQKMKQKVDEDIKLKLEELAAVQVADEVDTILREAITKIDEIETWLKEMEQSYLRRLTNMIKEMSGKEAMFTTPTPDPPTTTYRPLPSVKPDWSQLGGLLYTETFTSSPQLGDAGMQIYENEHIKQWRCIAEFWVNNRLYDSIGNFRSKYDSYSREEKLSFSFGIALRRPSEMSVLNKKEDYLAMERKFGGLIDDPIMTFVLTISYKPCDDPTWKWVTYSGVKFQSAENGWMTMSYKKFEPSDSTVVDPLSGDSSNSQILIISAFGSTARPTDCANDILGSGFYRHYRNSTCKGLPLFSKRAGKIDSACTDLMWGGMNVRTMWVAIHLEKSYAQCLEAVRPSQSPNHFSLASSNWSPPWSPPPSPTQPAAFNPFLRPVHEIRPEIEPPVRPVEYISVTEKQSGMRDIPPPR